MNLTSIANNNVAADIRYFLNQGGIGYTLNSGNTIFVKQGLRSLRIQNLSTSDTIAAGDIEIVTKREDL